MRLGGTKGTTGYHETLEGLVARGDGKGCYSWLGVLVDGCHALWLFISIGHGRNSG